eukprot:g13843.t1
MAFLRSIKPYRVRWFRLPTQNYYLPQNRNRIYFIGVHMDKVNLRVDMDLWFEDFARMEQGKDLTRKLNVLHCMYDEDSFPVRQEWYSEPMGSKRAGHRCLWECQSHKYREAMGWSLFEKPVDALPARRWLSKLNAREVEVLNLRALAAKNARGRLPRAKWWDALWVQDLGQNYRLGGFAFNYSPTVLPTGRFWVSQKMRYLLAEEALALQLRGGSTQFSGHWSGGGRLVLPVGFPVHEICFGNLPRAKICSLAGNAMSVPVMGVCLLQVFASCEFRKPEEANQARLLRLEEDARCRKELEEMNACAMRRGLKLDFGDAMDPVACVEKYNAMVAAAGGNSRRDRRKKEVHVDVYRNWCVLETGGEEVNKGGQKLPLPSDVAAILLKHGYEDPARHPARHSPPVDEKPPAKMSHTAIAAEASGLFFTARTDFFIKQKPGSHLLGPVAAESAARAEAEARADAEKTKSYLHFFEK